MIILLMDIDPALSGTDIVLRSHASEVDKRVSLAPGTEPTKFPQESTDQVAECGGGSRMGKARPGARG